MKHSRKWLAAFVTLLALIWGTGLIGFITLIPAESAGDTQNTDAIVVLTGGGLRLERGFELMAEHRAKFLFISGVEDGVSLASLLHNKEYRGFAEHIPAGSVFLGYKARSTLGNAEETAQWAEKNQVRSIRLVTGSYHIPRSISELKHAMPGVTIIAEPVFPRHFDHNEWWQWADSIRLVVSEYHKYLASLLRQRI